MAWDPTVQSPELVTVLLLGRVISVNLDVFPLYLPNEIQIKSILIKEMNDGFFLRKETTRPQSTGCNKK